MLFNPKKNLIYSITFYALFSCENIDTVDLKFNHLGKWVDNQNSIEFIFQKDSFKINNSPFYLANYKYINDTLLLVGSIGRETLFKGKLIHDVNLDQLDILRLDGGINIELKRPQKIVN
ncbi:MAG: hypothetical protein ACON4A_04510 [Flavobacteriaceae bacterium]